MCWSRVLLDIACGTALADACASFLAIMGPCVIEEPRTKLPEQNLVSELATVFVG